jgi:hypothetical protein
VGSRTAKFKAYSLAHACTILDHNYNIPTDDGIQPQHLLRETHYNAIAFDDTSMHAMVELATPQQVLEFPPTLKGIGRSGMPIAMRIAVTIDTYSPAGSSITHKRRTEFEEKDSEKTRQKMSEEVRKAVGKANQLGVGQDLQHHFQQVKPNPLPHTRKQNHNTTHYTVDGLLQPGEGSLGIKTNIKNARTRLTRSSLPKLSTHLLLIQEPLLDLLVTTPSPKTKRKNKKMMTSHNCWLRDLTADGIEPNPGPHKTNPNETTTNTKYTKKTKTKNTTLDTISETIKPHRRATKNHNKQIRKIKNHHINPTKCNNTTTLIFPTHIISALISHLTSLPKPKNKRRTRNPRSKRINHSERRRRTALQYHSTLPMSPLTPNTQPPQKQTPRKRKKRPHTKPRHNNRTTSNRKTNYLNKHIPKLVTTTLNKIVSLTIQNIFRTQTRARSVVKHTTEQTVNTWLRDLTRECVEKHPGPVPQKNKNKPHKHITKEIKKQNRKTKKALKSLRTNSAETIYTNLTNEETDPERKDRKDELISIIQNTSRLTSNCWHGDITENRDPFSNNMHGSLRVASINVATAKRRDTFDTKLHDWLWSMTAYNIDILVITELFNSELSRDDTNTQKKKKAKATKTQTHTSFTLKYKSPQFGGNYTLYIPKNEINHVAYIVRTIFTPYIIGNVTSSPDGRTAKLNIAGTKLRKLAIIGTYGPSAPSHQDENEMNTYRNQLAHLVEDSCVIIGDTNCSYTTHTTQYEKLLDSIPVVVHDLLQREFPDGAVTRQRKRENSATLEQSQLDSILATPNIAHNTRVGILGRSYQLIHSDHLLIMAEIPLDTILNQQQRDIELKKQQYPKRFQSFNIPPTPNRNINDVHKKRKLDSNIQLNNSKDTKQDTGKPSCLNAALFTKHITRITATRPKLNNPTTPEEIEDFAKDITKSITKAAKKSFKQQSPSGKQTFATAKLFREQHRARQVKTLLTQIKEDPSNENWTDVKTLSNATELITATVGRDYIDTHELDTKNQNSKKALANLIKTIKHKLKKLKTALKKNQSLKQSKVNLLHKAKLNVATHGKHKPIKMLKKLNDNTRPKTIPPMQLVEITDKKGNKFVTSNGSHLRKEAFKFWAKLWKSRKQSPPNTLSNEWYNYTPPPRHLFDNLTNQITLKEYNDLIHSLKNGTSPGPDGITYEMLKILDNDTHTNILTLLNAILEQAYYPLIFKKSYMRPIPKTEKPTTWADNRPIALCNVIGKLPAIIIANRFNTIDDLTTKSETPLFSKNQYAFRHARGTMEPLLTLNAVLEDALQYQKQLNLVSTDITKAYDTVENWTVENNMRHIGVNEHAIKLLSDMSTGCTTQIITTKGLTKPISMTRGIKQGDPLSCLRWNFTIDPLLRWLDQGREGYFIGTEKVTNTTFADDMVLYADKNTDINTLTNKATQYLHQNGIEFSPSKTKYAHNYQREALITPKVIVNDKHVDITIITENTPFRVLGVWFTLNMDWTHQTKIIDTAVRELTTNLSKRKYPLRLAANTASTVIHGKIIYPLQIARAPPSKIKEWDQKITAAVKSSARLSRSHPNAHLKLGPNTPSTNLLPLQVNIDSAVATEMIIRLNEQTQLATLLKHRLQGLQQALGLPTFPLSYPIQATWNEERYHHMAVVASALTRQNILAGTYDKQFMRREANEGPAIAEVLEWSRWKTVRPTLDKIRPPIKWVNQIITPDPNRPQAYSWTSIRSSFTNKNNTNLPKNEPDWYILLRTSISLPNSNDIKPEIKDLIATPNIKQTLAHQLTNCKLPKEAWTAQFFDGEDSDKMWLYQIANSEPFLAQLENEPTKQMCAQVYWWETTTNTHDIHPDTTFKRHETRAGTPLIYTVPLSDLYYTANHLKKHITKERNNTIRINLKNTLPQLQKTGLYAQKWSEILRINSTRAPDNTEQPSTILAIEPFDLNEWLPDPEDEIYFKPNTEGWVTLAGDAGYDWTAIEKKELKKKYGASLKYINPKLLPPKTLAYALIDESQGTYSQNHTVFTAKWSECGVLKVPKEIDHATFGEMWVLWRALLTAPNTNTHLISDSKAMISKFQKINNDTLTIREILRQPAAGLWIAIKEALKQRTTLFEISHTSSHVTCEEGGNALNSEADNLCTEQINSKEQRIFPHSLTSVGTPPYYLAYWENESLHLLTTDPRAWIKAAGRQREYNTWKISETGARIASIEPDWRSHSEGTKNILKHSHRYYERDITGTLPTNSRLHKWNPLKQPICKICDTGEFETMIHLKSECPTLSQERTATRADLSDWLDLSLNNEETINPESYIPITTLHELQAALGPNTTLTRKSWTPRDKTRSPFTTITITHTTDTIKQASIRESKFWELARNHWAQHSHWYNFTHNIIELITPLAQATHARKNHWMTRPSLLRILARELNINTELYSNALNASSHLEHHYSIQPNDTKWGLKIDCMSVSWEGLYAYANPEYTVEGMDAFYKKINTIRHAYKPTRIISILPDGEKQGMEGNWNTEKRIQETGGSILLRFPANTFSFLSDLYWHGSAKPKPTPLNHNPQPLPIDDGIRTTPNTIIIAIWENKSAREESPITEQFTEKIEMWKRTNTRKLQKIEPITTTRQAIEAVLANVLYRTKVQTDNLPFPLTNFSLLSTQHANDTPTHCPICNTVAKHSYTITNQQTTTGPDGGYDKTLEISCDHPTCGPLSFSYLSIRNKRQAERSDPNRAQPYYGYKTKTHNTLTTKPRRVTFETLFPYHMRPILGIQPTNNTPTETHVISPTMQNGPENGYLATNSGVFTPLTLDQLLVPRDIAAKITSTIISGNQRNWRARNKLYHEQSDEEDSDNNESDEETDPPPNPDIIHYKHVIKCARRTRDNIVAKQIRKNWLLQRPMTEDTRVTVQTCININITTDGPPPKTHTANLPSAKKWLKRQKELKRLYDNRIQSPEHLELWENVPETEKSYTVNLIKRLHTAPTDTHAPLNPLPPYVRGENKWNCLACGQSGTHTTRQHKHPELQALLCHQCHQAYHQFPNTKTLLKDDYCRVCSGIYTPENDTVDDCPTCHKRICSRCLLTHYPHIHTNEYTTPDQCIYCNNARPKPITTGTTLPPHIDSTDSNPEEDFNDVIQDCPQCENPASGESTQKCITCKRTWHKQCLPKHERTKGQTPPKYWKCRQTPPPGQQHCFKLLSEVELNRIASGEAPRQTLPPPDRQRMEDERRETQLHKQLHNKESHTQYGPIRQTPATKTTITVPPPQHTQPMTMVNRQKDHHLPPRILSQYGSNITLTMDTLNSLLTKPTTNPTPPTPHPTTRTQRKKIEKQTKDKLQKREAARAKCNPDQHDHTPCTNKHCISYTPCSLNPCDPENNTKCPIHTPSDTRDHEDR